MRRPRRRGGRLRRRGRRRWERRRRPAACRHGRRAVRAALRQGTSLLGMRAPRARAALLLRPQEQAPARRPHQLRRTQATPAAALLPQGSRGARHWRRTAGRSALTGAPRRAAAGAAQPARTMSQQAPAAAAGPRGAPSWPRPARTLRCAPRPSAGLPGGAPFCAMSSVG